MNTISTLFEPQGSIFQNVLLGGVQFKFGSDLTNFSPGYKNFTGVVLKFSRGGVLFKSGVQITSIQ